MNVLNYFEAIFIIIAIVSLSAFGILMIFLDIAMHRNVKCLIGDVIVTYQLYLIFRIADVFVVHAPNWLKIIVNVCFYLTTSASTIDSVKFVTERAIASIYPKSYEQRGSMIAWIMIAVEVSAWAIIEILNQDCKLYRN
jgi:hypothetical protein